ncbi:MAG: hypothetical protein HY075_01260 [Deltaproteobacteria bacterium]|nr:hypothetical protein [Deltaproteobacteria bacterium]
MLRIQPSIRALARAAAALRRPATGISAPIQNSRSARSWIRLSWSASARERALFQSFEKPGLAGQSALVAAS